MADTSKATIAAVVERLRIKASMIMLGEPIAWGSDSAVMDEAASLISALEAERDTLKTINANLMGDDENLPRYTTRRLKQEIARHIEAAEAQVAALQAKLEKAAETLEWYGEQARLARLMHSGGDAGRHALQDDGGKRARSTLSTLREASDA